LLVDVQLTNNQAPLGGGIVFAPTSAGPALLLRVVIENNVADSGLGQGGGIAWAPAGGLWIIDSLIANNYAQTRGGGIADAGGSSIKVVNTTISDNSSGGQGGGAYVLGQMNLRHVTLAGNSAPDGAGVKGDPVYGGSVNFKDTIIAHNGTSTNCSSGGNYTSSGYNLDDDGGCVSGTSDMVADPLLDPAALSDNGGPTQTYSLLIGSPAIDAGDPADTTPSDQRGYHRPHDGNGDGIVRTDIGAYEALAASGSGVVMVCGNGTLEWPEACDDGNATNGDGCSAICQLEATPPTGGGMVLEPGPLVQIKPEARLKLLPACGNGKVEGSEQCDDGNLTKGDGCSATCTIEAVRVYRTWKRIQPLFRRTAPEIR
jgi:cysteine-rich repeat protein